MITSTQKARLKSWNIGNADSATVPTILDRAEKVVALEYDFASQGGAVSDINLTDALGATYATEEACIVTKILTQEVTSVTSGGSATITVKAGSTSLTGALAYNTAFTGLDLQTLSGSAAAIAVPTASTLKITIGTAAITAGKIRFFIYLLPQRAN